MDKLMEAMRRDGAIDAIGRPTKVAVSYTHLTLPTSDLV